MGSRYVYALSVQDVIDYVTDTTVGDGALQNYNIWKMFWNTTSQPSTVIYPWLRSASASDSGYVGCVDGSVGSVGSSSYSNVDSRTARPAFTIDLSKVDFEIQ